MQRRTFIQAASVVGVFGVLSACAPGSESTPQNSRAPADSAVTPAEVAKLGDVELTVWDQEVRGSQDVAMKTLNEAFMAKYPNVTVKRNPQSFDDYQKQVALALSGNDVPDVCQINNARKDMGEFVKAGQLVDLTRYRDVYKWDERFPKSVLSKMSYSPDGVTFGEGSLWGLPQTGEICGVFYSQKMLDKLGGTLPATWEDYFKLLENAKDMGVTPMALGNIEKWPALHVFGPLQTAFVPSGQVVMLGMGNEGANWTSAENVEALEKFAQWGKDHFFGESPNGLDYDTAWADFTKGKYAFMPGGSWLGGDMEKVMGEDLRFMVPPAGKDGKVATTGGTGLPWSIPAKSKNHEAAAAYLDFITSEEAMELTAQNGGMPVINTAKLAPAKGVQKDIFEAFSKVSTEGVLLPYLDYATPTFSDTVGNTLQELLAGQKDANSAAKVLQKDYADFTAGEH